MWFQKMTPFQSSFIINRPRHHKSNKVPVAFISEIAVLGRPRPPPDSRPGRPRPNFFLSLSSSDVLVPVLVLVLDVPVLRRPIIF